MIRTLDDISFMLSIIGEACNVCVHFKEEEHRFLWKKKTMRTCTMLQKELGEFELARCKGFKFNNEATKRKETIHKELEEQRILEKAW